MRQSFSSITAAAAVAAGLTLAGARPVAQVPRGARTVAATSATAIREWDTSVDRLARAGALVSREVRVDSFVSGREHERFDQYHGGVRVFGGDVVRQLDRGATVSIFGTIHEGIAVDTTPALAPEQAKAIVEARGGVELGPDRQPELVVLPTDDGRYVLGYALRAMTLDGLMQYVVDAERGDIVLEFNDLKTQSAIGKGQGVLGDRKKLSVVSNGSMFRSSDETRPPSVVTFDMRGDVARTLQFLNGNTRLTMSDVGADTDNDWSDGAVVDAHVYAGWTYDYYFRRFGRRGLDNRDIEIVSLVHPVNRNTPQAYPPQIIGLFFLNAGYFGNGLMVYGEGLPPGLTDSEGRSWNYTSGALDVVAHELTHGVTDFSSRLIYRNESGALNEAFSDIVAIGAEFFYQPSGSGPLHADYTLGEDIVTPGGIRSAATPTAYGDPDHYSERYKGTEDNGGVHINSGIANHAFYLAVEGGTHRLSRQLVHGVGAGAREQVERVFYRAFTEMLPSNATFAIARAATIQSARDLYGPGSAAERAVTEAWSAVGVQ
jgi:thermolysin